MSKISKIKALEILDSRGNPTIEVIIYTGKMRARACVPSGASTGKHEALELRDKNKRRYGGKGILKAVKNVENIIAKKLEGMNITDQKRIDKTLINLDGTKNKSKLGANTILGVSLACARLGARVKNQPLYKYISQMSNIKYQMSKLPIPMFNIINGGKHADSGLDIQEFMIVPAGIKKYSEQLRAGSEIFHALKIILQKYGFRVAVGDEGGFAPRLKDSEAVFKILIKAIKKAGYKPGKDVFIAIDVAASEFTNLYKFTTNFTNKYKFEGKKLTSGEMINIYKKWLKKYPLISIEDGLAEDNWMGWKILSEKLKIKNEKLRIQHLAPNTQHLTPILIGDDLFTTNVERLNKGISLGVANAILIKPNQIGTLTETIDCIKLAQKNNYKIIVSHRSGETSDPFISDLAVACGVDFIKAGAPNRGERTAKYNRLLEIEKGI